MPELPEVQALADFLAERAVGRAVAGIDVVALSVLKTHDPPPSSLRGLAVTGAARHGKFLDVDCDGLHLVTHLARAGWLRWKDTLPAKPPRPGKGPLALRVRLAGGAADGTGSLGWDLTEQGTHKRLAVYVVRDPTEVPGVARLGTDPLGEFFTRAALAGLASGTRTRLKGFLTDQHVLAGIGNAYSDEILHLARLSPYALAANLTGDELDRLHSAVREVLTEAVERSRGLATGELKGEKHRGLRVHGRTGESCPTCDDTIREVSFADSALQYCPTCQTGGRVLADRRLSRLVK